MTRPYTGWDGDARGRRAGTEKFVQIVCFLSGNKLWNNGTWMVRSARGKTLPSVHGTGRAIDLSWRVQRDRNRGGTYAEARKMIDFLVEWADVLGIEYIADYNPGPGGSAWRCDRGTWKQYDAGKIQGAPGGDWFHIEIAPANADNPGFFDAAFKSILNGTARRPIAPTPTPAPKPDAPKVQFKYPGAPIKMRSRNSDAIKLIQAGLGIEADGKFGPQTKAAVEKAQASKRLPVTGVVDEATWKAIVG